MELSDCMVETSKCVDITCVMVEISMKIGIIRIKHVLFGCLFGACWELGGRPEPTPLSL